MLNVPPVGSRLLVLHPGEPAATAHTASKQVVAEIALSDAWQVVGAGANALTLDTAEVGSYQGRVHCASRNYDNPGSGY